jgi:hypothetical protein
VCRTENQKVIFTEQIGTEYQQIKVSDIVAEDEKSGVSFTSQAAYMDTMELLIFRCQLCKEMSEDMKSLAEHIREEHEKYLCTICSQNKKAFPSELKIYTHKQLQNHQMRGDEKGFNGHPLCKFCKGRRFYSDDELTLHLRQSHEKCHVCDQIDPSAPQYFKNYNSLEEHFKNDHFSCQFQSCLEKKFVVFADEIDLQAHMLSEHKESVGKSHIIGTSTRARNNGYQLSTFRSSQASRSNNAQSEDVDSLETKCMRFEERARHYLNYSTTAFKQFTHLNNEYRNGAFTAAGLKNSYQKLFKNNKENEIYLLLFDFAQLFDKSSHQGKDLSKFIEDHEKKISQEQDFPVLPGSSTSLSSFGSSWGNGSTSSKKNIRSTFNESFPALPLAGSSYKPVKTTVRYTTLTKQSKPATVRVNSTPSTTFPNYLSNSASSSTSSFSSRSKAKLNEEEFPELPKIEPKKTYPIRNPANRPQPVQTTSVWGTSNTKENSMNLDPLEDSLPIITKGKGKKKKQILFTMGGR